MRKLLAVLGVVFMAGSVSAALVIEESFVYDAGALNGQNGGTGFTGAWANTRNSPTAATPGFTWGTLPVAGNYARGAAWSGVARPIGSTLADAGLLADDTTLWFSVIFGLENQNTSNADLNLALTNAAKFNSSTFGDRENLDSTTGTEEGIGVTHSGGWIQAVYWQNSDADNIIERHESANSTVRLDGSGPLTPDHALIVGKIDWTGSGETLTLYAPDTSLVMGSPIVSLDVPNLNQGVFNNLALQFKDQAQMDEIRFGATYADVVGVPEPSTLALLGLGVLGLGLNRIRRRK